MVKASFIGFDGAVVASFNLYLDEADTWVAAITLRNGQPVLGTTDPTCLLVENEGVVARSSEVELSEQAGFFQFIEMAEVADPDLAGIVEDCDALAERWNEGAWNTDPAAGLSAPIGRLRSQTTLINVQRGTSYSYGATALDEFSDIVQHSRPGSEKPDLISAHDAGTDSGATTSKLCDSSRCVTDQWENPRDAVTAALTINRVAGEFSLSEALGAKSEWVLTYPMAAFFENHIAVFDIVIFDRVIDDFAVAPEFMVGTTTVGSGGRSVVPFRVRRTGANLPGGQAGAIVGLQRVDLIGDTGVTEGWIQLDTAGPVLNRFLETETHRYFGIAAIPVAFQEFVNGTLIDDSGRAIRANYGFSIPLNLSVDLDIIHQEKD